ncbi:hypothetical protein WA158_004294 [Blastocystis sp. Blastoise]
MTLASKHEKFVIYNEHNVTRDIRNVTKTVYIEKTVNLTNQIQDINDFVLSTTKEIYPSDNYGIDFRKPSCAKRPESKIKQGKYSSVLFHPNQLGIILLEFYNICFDFKSRTITYFIENDSEQKLFERNRQKYLTFMTGVSIQTEKQFHNQTVFLEHSNALYLISIAINQIAHFTETANILLSINMRFRKFPFTDTVIYEIADHPNDWIFSYYNLIKSLYPSNITFSNLREATERYGKNKCFKHFYVSNRVVYSSYGGIFSSIRDSDTIRILAYKHIDIDPYTMKRHSKPFITLLNRNIHKRASNNRLIININELEQYFKSNFNNKLRFDYSIVDTEKFTFKEQLQFMVKTDILIGTVGTGFLNSMFMLPYSSIIAVYPPYSDNIFFTASSRTSRIYFIPYYNNTVHYRNNTPEYACVQNILSKFPNTYDCRRLLYYSDVYVDPFSLFLILQTTFYYFLYNN